MPSARTIEVPPLFNLSRDESKASPGRLIIPPDGNADPEQIANAPPPHDPFTSSEKSGDGRIPETGRR